MLVAWLVVMVDAIVGVVWFRGALGWINCGVVCLFIVVIVGG